MKQHRHEPHIHFARATHACIHISPVCEWNSQTVNSWTYGRLYCTLRKCCAFASKIIKLSLMRIKKWVHIDTISSAHTSEWQSISNAKRFTINWAWNDVANKLLYAYSLTWATLMCMCVCAVVVVIVGVSAAIDICKRKLRISSQLCMNAKEKKKTDEKLLDLRWWSDCAIISRFQRKVSGCSSALCVQKWPYGCSRFQILCCLTIYRFTLTISNDDFSFFFILRCESVPNSGGRQEKPISIAIPTPK